MPSPLATLVLSLLVQLTAAGPGPTMTPPQSIKALADAYSERSAGMLDGLLTGDFRFSTTDVNLPSSFHEVDRGTWLQSASNIFGGRKQDGKIVQPGSESLTMIAEGFTENADPEHPDSTEQYRLVAVTRLAFQMKLPGGPEIRSTPALHVFHVVRGDAAVPAGGQTADPERWYIRRWLEDVNGLESALGKVEGDCKQADSAMAPEALAVLPLAIHALGNPACPTLDIACDLPAAGPARIEVFDVMGRRLQQKDFDVVEPGTMKLQAGRGVRLAPGAYWVRLSQASRRSTRMVVVAR